MAYERKADREAVEALGSKVSRVADGACRSQQLTVSKSRTTGMSLYRSISSEDSCSVTIG